ncbi:hypothetical protein HO929_11560, partial [Streptococcus suis]|nr:hypothetical protein [Streptococcus suis]
TDTPVDEPYGDTPPATIEKDGKTYELVRTRTNEGDAPENGVVKEGEQTITYEYKEKVETPVVKTGSVVARYVIEGTEDEIADDKSVKPTDTPVDEPYGDTPPATITKDGKTYELVRTRTNEGDAPSNGTVVEGEQTITYEYKEKVETPVVKTGFVGDGLFAFFNNTVFWGIAFFCTCTNKLVSLTIFFDCCWWCITVWLIYWCIGWFN